MIAASYTFVHPIDEDSPLYDFVNQAEVAEMDEDELVVSIALLGMDAVYHDSTCSIKRYYLEDLEYDQTFSDLMQLDEDGQASIDFSNFNILRPISELSRQDRLNSSVDWIVEAKERNSSSASVEGEKDARSKTSTIESNRKDINKYSWSLPIPLLTSKLALNRVYLFASRMHILGLRHPQPCSAESIAVETYLRACGVPFTTLEVPKFGVIHLICSQLNFIKNILFQR